LFEGIFCFQFVGSWLPKGMKTKKTKMR